MNSSEILIYQNADGKIKIDVRLEDETVWLTQAHMAELFQVKPQNITNTPEKHLCGGGVERSCNCKDFLQV